MAPLNPELKAFLDEWNKKPPVPKDISPNTFRKQIGTDAIPPRKAPYVKDILVPVKGGEIVTRIYRPEGDGPFPVCVFFHGGGFVGGSVDGYDYPLHDVCLNANCIVASVEYRLAPENKFPIPFTDCYEATKWISEHAAEFKGDPERLAVSGVSAGGTLSAAVSLMARNNDDGPKICFQAVMYAVLDMARSYDSPSRSELAEGYYHCNSTGDVFDAFLLRSDEDRKHPFLSPILIDDLSNMPKTLVMTMEYDPLRDEGKLYAEKLLEAGNLVDYYTAPGMIHNSFIWSVWCADAKKAVNDYFIESLKKAFYE